MKTFGKVLITAALLTSATAAYAASHSYREGSNTNQGNEGSTFWTVYAKNAYSQSITVNDGSRRDVSMDWELKDADGADYVAGGGWEYVPTPNNVYYKLFDWNTPRGKGTFGVYGWSCDVPAGNLNVEYYVVDSWFGGWTPTGIECRSVQPLESTKKWPRSYCFDEQRNLSDLSVGTDRQPAQCMWKQQAVQAGLGRSHGQSVCKGKLHKSRVRND